MATIRKSAQAPVPVERAQLINPGDFRFSTESAKTLQGIGGVLSELGERKSKAEDSLSVNAAGESRDLAKERILALIKTNPDPSAWGPELQKIFNDQNEGYSKLSLSKAARANQDIEQKAFMDEWQVKVSTAATTRTIDNDITVSGKNLIDKISNDDESELAAVDIQKQIELYREALQRKDTEEISEIKMGETLVEGEKQRISNFIQQGKFGQAKELAKKNENFTPTERNAQLNIIEKTKVSQENIIKSNSEIFANKAIEEGYAKIIKREDESGQVLDIESLISDVQNDPNITSDASNEVAKKLMSFYNTWNTTTSKVKRDAAYNPSLAASLKTEARNVENVANKIDIKDRSATALAKNEIDIADFETISIDAEKTFKIATDKAIDDGESRFASIQLKGTSNESLTPWIQSQVLQKTLTGEEVSPVFVTDLITKFQDIGKAKQWSVNQTRNEVIATIDSKENTKEKIDTVDGIRLLYLQTQKKWLRKTDIELVEEYRNWMDSKQ